MPYLPIGIQTFEKIREKNYHYVDKTAYLARLADPGGYFFFARPRRFGKSVLVTTLQAIFEGKRKLFRGLEIERRFDWVARPVLHFDFAGMRCEGEAEVLETLNILLDRCANRLGIRLSEARFDLRFQELIEAAGKKGPVVVLVDEYDKPLLDNIQNEEMLQKARMLLGDFYVALKKMDRLLHLVFITGVSKFSKVSIFSSLNNMQDVSFHREFAAMAGYTETELTGVFHEELGELAAAYDRPTETMLGILRDWYDGYSWDGKTQVYNPFSILNLFAEKQFRNFWFESGTPAFLIAFLKKEKLPLNLLENALLSSESLEPRDIGSINPISLLFETGYLTVREISFDQKTLKAEYRLGYPNREVKDSLLTNIFAGYSGHFTNEVPGLLRQVQSCFSDGDLKSVFELLNGVFASIPYNIFKPKEEAYFHSVVYLVLTLLGLEIEAEIQTQRGRIDAVVKTRDRIYVLEFKMGSALDAMNQIIERGYPERYRQDPRAVLAVGVGFDREKRNIGGWQSRQIN